MTKEMKGKDNKGIYFALTSEEDHY
jgi:hypothetical protein